MYPRHDKQNGPFPTRTVTEIADDIVRVLEAGAKGSAGERRHAAVLLFRMKQEVSVSTTGDAHTLIGLLSRCFDSMRELTSPFAPYLATPPAVTDLYQAHGDGIRDACDDLNGRLSEMLRDVSARLVTSLSWESLIRIGLDTNFAAPLVITAEVLDALERTPVWKKYLASSSQPPEDRLREDLRQAIGATAESVEELAHEAIESVYPNNMGGGVPIRIWLTIAKLADKASFGDRPLPPSQRG